MASSLEYVQFVADQLHEAGEIVYKKMFGEYGLYCNGKFFAVVCDNRFLVKITEAGKALLPDYKTELPYEGGKPMLFIEDLDNQDLLKELALVTCAELPDPKPKKRKK